MHMNDTANDAGNRRRPATLSLLAAAAVMAMLYATSSVPGDPPADPTLVQQAFSWFSPTVYNLLHIPAYALLAWTLFHCFQPPLGMRAGVLLAIAAAAVYGAGMELHQAGIPGRYPSLTDVALNGIGAALGAAFAARRATARTAT